MVALTQKFVVSTSFSLSAMLANLLAAACTILHWLPRGGCSGACGGGAAEQLLDDRVLALFSRLTRPRAYVTDISLADMPTRTLSMLLDTIRVGPNTYMGVS